MGGLTENINVSVTLTLFGGMNYLRLKGTVVCIFKVNIKTKSHQVMEKLIYIRSGENGSFYVNFIFYDLDLDI